ncbi:SCO family protein [Deinococcus sp.]|uniref:SCO family protein n=1 Tax=Deinococcus sp. TaxID=47478 RepID=UPI002869C99D|nr:SCO family protein [Deinococcus sp.]
MTDVTPASTSDSAPTRPWYASALLAVVGVILLLLAAWAYARWQSPHPFYGTAYQNVPATPLSGTAQDGRAYTFTPGAGGRTTALFFGFTHCANICPLTLSYLNKVRAALPETQRRNFQVLLVSVDPVRDTPARLGEYVSYFGSGTGLRIPEPALGEAARAYGVGYQRVDVKGGDYQMNHTTATYLIDAAGKIRLLWDYTQLPQVERVVADVQYVMEHP